MPDDAKQLVATLLADVLMVPNQQTAGATEVR